MRLLCTPCWERDQKRPAVNAWYVRAYGATPRCEDCEADAGEAREQACLSTYYGGGWMSDRERMDEARRLK